MTLLIKGVEIYDGRGRDPVSGDIFVSGDRISAIGAIPARHVDAVIEGQGIKVCPGFVDAFAKSDHYCGLLDEPKQEEFLRNGITSVIGGQEGVSLAPLFPGNWDLIENWSGRHRNLGWHSLAGFLEYLSRRPLGVNFGTLVGYDTVRRAFLKKGLDRSEVAFLGRVLQTALVEGGLGISLKWNEDKALMREARSVIAAAGKRKNIVVLDSVPADSAKEAAEIFGKGAGEVVLTNFIPEAAAGREIRAHFTIVPFLRHILPARAFLPQRLNSKRADVLTRALKDDWFRAKMVREMPEIDPKRFTVVQAPNHDPLAGSTLQDVAELYRFKDPREALIHLLIVTGCRALADYPALAPETLRSALTDPRSLLGTAGTSFDRERKPRAVLADENPSALLYFLSLAAAEGLMSLPSAIRKITSEPARIFGLKDRGELSQGKFADIIGFSLDPASSEVNVRFAVVNGKLVMKEGEFREPAGRILLGK